MPSTLASLILLAAITAAAQTAQPVGGHPQPLDGTVTGTVTNDDGDPIEGANLCTEVTYESGSGTTCGGNQTDAHGHFSIRVPLGKIGVYAQKQEGGYWPVTDASPSHTKGIRRLTLTSDAPTAKVTLKIGPKPGELKVSVKDKTTGKAVEGFGVRWIGMDNAYMMSFAIPMPTLIPPGVDVIVEVHAKGYRRWFYIDPATSQPTLRLASGEERQLDVELEPEEKK
jgi:hypothetical protein